MTFLRVSETSWVQLNSAQAENSKIDIYWFSCENPVNFLWPQKLFLTVETVRVLTGRTGEEKVRELSTEIDPKKP